jgi:hypothetical protein
MTDNVFGKRFWGFRDAAWHLKGYVSQTPKNGVTALSDIGGGYWFEKRFPTVILNGHSVELDDFSAIVRSPVPDDPTERVFDFVTGRYNILQPLEVVELFDDKVKENVETLLFLGQGETMCITWELPKFDVVKGDTVKLYGFLVVGFNGKVGASLNIGTVRIVCQNTLVMALSEAENSKGEGMGRIFSGKHTMKNLKYKLGEWMSYVQTNAKRQTDLTKSLFKRLANTPLEEENEVYRLLFSAFPDPKPLAKNAYIPPTLRKDEEKSIEEDGKLKKKYRDGIYNLFAGAGTEITPNYWGLLNATTEYFNYGQVIKKPANASIILGPRSDNMNQMVEVLNYESQKKLAK